MPLEFLRYVLNADSVTLTLYMYCKPENHNLTMVLFHANIFWNKKAKQCALKNSTKYSFSNNNVNEYPHRMLSHKI